MKLSNDSSQKVNNLRRRDNTICETCGEELDDDNAVITIRKDKSKAYGRDCRGCLNEKKREQRILVKKPPELDEKIQDFLCKIWR